MTQYEYLIVASDQGESTNHVQETFNQYGTDGWKLVETSKKFFIFCREVEAVPVDSFVEWVGDENRSDNSD